MRTESETLRACSTAKKKRSSGEREERRLAVPNNKALTNQGFILYIWRPRAESNAGATVKA